MKTTAKCPALQPFLQTIDRARDQNVLIIY